MQYAFQGCTSLTAASFPELSSVVGTRAMADVFNRCTRITSLTFPKLKYLAGNAVFGGLWNNMTLDSTTISFPELLSIKSAGTNAGLSPFYWNQNITRIDFPKLSVISPDDSDSLNALYLFGSCTNLVEIHFAAANQELIESASGYSTEWGAPNSSCQVVFDL